MKNKPDENLLSGTWNNMWDWSVYSDDDLRLLKGRDKLATIKKMGFSLKKDSKILDGGCGDGQVILNFMKDFSAKGYGLDLSSKALKKASDNAQKMGLKINLSLGDVRNLPYDDNFFDAALSFGVIEHFTDYEKAIKEMARVLKKGGKAIFVQPNKHSFGPLYRKYRQWQGKWRCGFQLEFTGKELGKLLKANGFTSYNYIVRGPYKDMPYVYPPDSLVRIFWKGWGHYLYLIGIK